MTDQYGVIQHTSPNLDPFLISVFTNHFDAVNFARYLSDLPSASDSLCKFHVVSVKTDAHMNQFKWNYIAESEGS